MNNRFISGCITFLLGINFTTAQEILPLQHDTSYFKGEFILHGDAFYHSNTIRTEFANTLLWGGYITDEMKDASLKNAAGRPRNRFGGTFSSGLEYRNYTVNLFGKEDWGFLVKAGYEIYAGAQFTRDAFSLLFKGNAHVTDNMADLTDLRFDQITYQKIGFGVVDKRSKSAISLNLVNAQSFTKMHFVNGEYRQSPQTDSVSLLLKGDYSSASGGMSNGLGFALDADFRIEIPWGKAKTAYIRLKAENIGVAFFNNQTKNYSLDTMYRYSGFEISELTSSFGNGNEEFSLADSLNIRPSEGGKAVWLPGYIQLAKIVDRTNPAKLQPFFGINVYTNAIYLPQVFAGIHYQPHPIIAIGAQASYGGFGELRGGFYLDLKLGQFYLGVGTQDAYGAVSKNGLGQSLTGRITWKID